MTAAQLAALRRAFRDLSDILEAHADHVAGLEERVRYLEVRESEREREQARRRWLRRAGVSP